MGGDLGLVCDIVMRKLEDLPPADYGRAFTSAVPGSGAVRYQQHGESLPERLRTYHSAAATIENAARTCDSAKAKSGAHTILNELSGAKYARWRFGQIPALLKILRLVGGSGTIDTWETRKTF